jgi:hypothetical protein
MTENITNQETEQSKIEYSTIRINKKTKTLINQLKAKLYIKNNSDPIITDDDVLTYSLNHSIKNA